MILALDKDNTRVLVVLEPGNVQYLMEGRPLVRNLAELPDGPQLELAIAYTPDVEYMFGQVRKGVGVLKALQMSLARTPVFRAPQSQPNAGQVN